MKTWIKTNLSKITLALALTGATTGTIGLIMGGVLTHNVGTNVKHYLDHNKQIIFGTSTIWERKNHSKDIMDLYFAINKFTDDAIEWDGTYPDGYFNK
ncbi:MULTISPECIES: hypothetical protein [unclassified Spiroplasma]|uniref:hypothetical protein n=1 Tax=unclassified Spiroplasma TaxID=2637901 RepID=UPI0030CFD35B